MKRVDGGDTSVLKQDYEKKVRTWNKKSEIYRFFILNFSS